MVTKRRRRPEFSLCVIENEKEEQVVGVVRENCWRRIRRKFVFRKRERFFWGNLRGLKMVLMCVLAQY